MAQRCEARRLRPGRRAGLAAWLALLALVLQAALPPITALAKAASPSPAGSIELVLCTPEGLRRITLGTEDGDQAPRSTPAPFCPVCLATSGPPVLAPPAVDLTRAFGFVTRSWPCPEGSSRSTSAVIQPPARGPPAT